MQVAKENADVIIMDDHFTTIVNVAKWGRAVYINIQKFVQFQLTVNVVALVLNFVSACVSGLLVYEARFFIHLAQLLTLLNIATIVALFIFHIIFRVSSLNCCAVALG